MQNKKNKFRFKKSLSIKNSFKKNKEKVWTQQKVQIKINKLEINKMYKVRFLQHIHKHDLNTVCTFIIRHVYKTVKTARKKKSNIKT